MPEANAKPDLMDLLRELTALPHRGAGTPEETKAAAILLARVRAMGAQADLEPVRTPPTYISEVWWLLGALMLGLLLVPVLHAVALLWLAFTVGSALAYFDWRESWVSSLPPQITAHNIVATVPRNGITKDRVILMAHYDSAPVSRLYQPSMVASFRSSLLASLGVMVLAVLVAALEVMGRGLPYLTYLRWGLILYFLVQGALTTMDYMRYGFTNGAADNGSGTVVAVAVAQRLWRDPIPGWSVELVLTSAEEANLKGSLAYFKARRPFDMEHTYVLNFDNVGSGSLKIVTCTGTITDVVYNNRLVRAAVQVADSEPRFSTVRCGTWRTGDFDSIWFARAGIASLTLSAQDERGLIANLHRPSDTLDHVDPEVLNLAIDLGEATVRRLAQDGSAPTKEAQAR